MGHSPRRWWPLCQGLRGQACTEPALSAPTSTRVGEQGPLISRQPGRRSARLQSLLLAVVGIAEGVLLLQKSWVATTDVREAGRRGEGAYLIFR